MKSMPCNAVSRPDPARGFTRAELLVIIAITGVLSRVLLATPEHGREKSHVLTDLNNLRQILIATSMYETQNQEYLPHPNWGTVGSIGAGPDGWAYATRNAGRITNAPDWIPSCQGRNTNSIDYTNQLKFFRIGQLGPYLGGIKPMYCPKDVEQWAVDPFRNWYMGRHVKLTSYVMNPSVGGYIPSDSGLNGKTYKVSEFKSKDIIFWEQDETDGFNFNDASSDPGASDGIITQRHYGTGAYSGNASTTGGGGVIGRINGAAEFMLTGRFLALARRANGTPNDLLNGPGYRR